MCVCVGEAENGQGPSVSVDAELNSFAPPLDAVSFGRHSPTRCPKGPPGKEEEDEKKEDASFLVFPGDITDWPSQLWLSLKGPAEPAIKLCNKSRKKGRQEAERYT